MSIIHDALKKVQKGLSSKSDEVEVINEDSSEIEILPPSRQETVVVKSIIQNKIKSALALICATTITVLSVMYICQQFKNEVPLAQRFAKNSFNKLIHQLQPLNTKTPAHVAPAPKPLAQITINPLTTKTSESTKPAPTTLDIHGIMANATGNLVLINDQVYQEGDEIDGAKIIKINLDSITINNNGTQQTIFVKN